MSQIDLFEDSQNNNDEGHTYEQDDQLSGSATHDQEPEVDHLPRIQRRDDMAVLRQDIKDLKENQARIMSLLEKIAANKGATVFHIETSTMKKPFIAFLKRRFLQYPWFSDDNIEIKSKIVKLLRETGVEADDSNILKSYSFALHQYTNWRNQVRHKLLSTDKNVAQLSLDALQDYLFSAFKGAGMNNKEDVLQENRKITIALRAFADNQGIFANRRNDQDFWKKFKKTLDRIEVYKWKELEMKQTRKIEDINKVVES